MLAYWRDLFRAQAATCPADDADQAHAPAAGSEDPYVRAHPWATKDGISRAPGSPSGWGPSGRPGGSRDDRPMLKGGSLARQGRWPQRVGQAGRLGGLTAEPNYHNSSTQTLRNQAGADEYGGRTGANGCGSLDWR